MDWLLLGAFAAGLVLGAGIVYLFFRKALAGMETALERAGEKREELERGLADAQAGRTRAETLLEREKQAAEEKLAVLEDAKTKLMDSFRALSSEALAKNNASFLDLARSTLEKYQEGAKNDLEKRQTAIDRTVRPVGEALKTFNERIEALEKERSSAYAGLREQLRSVAGTQTELSRTTDNLVQALRAPQVRGRWGEMQLRRTVELAGMVQYCDFEEQASHAGADGAHKRPDLVIRLPNERRVVVDAKAPMAAYLEALEATGADEKTMKMKNHARQLREHIKGLAAKAYWERFASAPEFVVLFLPNEALFSAALEQEPELIEQGARERVILATPTTLIALLKSVAYGWQQEAVAREAKEISDLGKELYERIGVVVDHVSRLGRSLDQSVGHYNNTIRSMESRLLVTARRFEALESSSGDEIRGPGQIEKTAVRPQAAPETGAEEGPETDGSERGEVGTDDGATTESRGRPER